MALLEQTTYWNKYLIKYNHLVVKIIGICSWNYQYTFVISVLSGIGTHKAAFVERRSLL